MERCPTCQARLRDEAVCPRCRTDLTVPLAVAATAEAELRYAVAALTANDRAAALTALRRSLACRRTPLAEQLQAWLVAAAHAGECPAQMNAESAGNPDSGSE